jgi:diguanylate cyclase (GGDEF)-like protein
MRKTLTKLDITRPHTRFFLRFMLLAVVGLGVTLGWWPIPWRIYTALVLAAIPLYLLIWWKLPLRTAHLVDMPLFVTLLLYSGGSSSPFVFLAYVWFFWGVILNIQANRPAPVLLSGLTLLVALAFGSWPSPGWPAFLVLHLAGLAVSLLLGLALVTERSQGRSDPLTGVLHRRSGLERLRAWTESRQTFNLSFVDMKGFKRINDTYGHAVGDEVIQAVAGRLKGAVRGSDIIMRYGGDEFVVASRLLSLRPRLEAALSSPVRTSIGVLEVSADIGEVKWHPGEPLEELLAEADAAMYRAKHGEQDAR